jgi:hypothetical protein
MQKSILLLVGLLAAVLASAQTQFPIVQQDNEWNVLIVTEGSNSLDSTYHTVNYRINGDTTLNNQAYKKIYNSMEEFPANWTYYGAIREDNQKVWFLSASNNPEALLYDFDLNVGDTINILHDPMIVDSIIDKPINNEDRKHIYFSYYDSIIKEVWIEGIGSNKGFLSPGSGFAVGGRYWLLCMKEQASTVYMNPNFNHCFMASGISENKSSVFHLYPNPANNQVKITVADNLMIESISIIDMNGKRLKEFEHTDAELDLSGIPGGVYIIQLIHNKGKTHQKLIVE